MKAAQISEYGGPSVIKINEIEKPIASDGKVLIEVHAASLNPFDTSIREGHVSSMVKSLPITLGGDISGVITEVGADVQNFKVGDKIYGQASVVSGGSGAFAEFAFAKAEQLAKTPSILDFKQASSLPLVGVSALQALTEHIILKAGQKIFIHGGAGGIGTIAIQIAKHLGSYVATTAKGQGIDLVKKLGADEVIDYTSQNFVEILTDFDAVFDTVGGDDFNKLLSVLKKGGTAVTMAAKPDEAKAKELGVTAIHQGTHITTDRLDKLTKLVEDLVIVPQVDKVFPLDKTKEAFEARENASVQGKIVIEIKS